MMLSRALSEHFPLCLPSSVGDPPPPVAEQLHYSLNPPSAVTSAEHLTEISPSCVGSYASVLTCAAPSPAAFGSYLFPACAAVGSTGTRWSLTLP